VGRDITERKKTEKEIRKRVEELENFYKITITRKIKMKQQKEEIEKLKSELSKYKQ
jgi:polyhydroxyalkanoate synthesis regulator phasin